MKNRNRGLLCLALPFVWLGCATTPMTRVDPPDPRPLGEDLPNAKPSESADQAASHTSLELGGELTLTEALSAALLQSPVLAAYSWEIRAQEAERMQAGVTPSLELAAELENVLGTGESSGFKGAEATLSISKAIELGDKRSKRIELASRSKELALWDYEVSRLEVLTKTHLLFLEVLAAQERLALAGELVQLDESILNSVSQRVAAGATSRVEESRARVELEAARIAFSQAESELTSKRRLLASTWGSHSPEFSRVVGNLGDTPEPPALGDLLEKLNRNPSLARWASEQKYHAAQVALENAMGRSDLSVGAGVRYARDAKDAALVFELGMPLGGASRTRGATDAARMRFKGAAEEHRGRVIDLQTEVAGLYESLGAAHAEVSSLRERAIPEAESAFEAAQEAYLRGAMRFTDVLDTERLLFQLKNQYFSSLVRYHRTEVEIERRIAGPIEWPLPNTGRR